MPAERITMSKKVTSGVWMCPDGFVAATKSGISVHVHAGAIVPYHHPYEIMEGREALFVDVSEPRRRAEPVVEQATAAPGEKRTTRRASTKGDDD